MAVITKEWRAASFNANDRTQEIEMQIYITDKTGRRFWNTDVAAGFSQGERRNLDRHLGNIRASKRGYEFIDAATARIVEEGVKPEMSDAELLAALTQ